MHEERLDRFAAGLDMDSEVKIAFERIRRESDLAKANHVYLHRKSLPALLRLEPLGHSPEPLHAAIGMRDRAVPARFLAKLGGGLQLLLLLLNFF